MKRILNISILFCAIIISISAQDKSKDTIRPRYGIFLNGNYNNHFSNFRKLPGIPNCCKDFDGGNGLGYSLGFLYEQSLHDFYAKLFKTEKPYGLTGQLRLGYYNMSAKLIGNDKTYVYIAKQDAIVEGEFEHQIDATLGMILLEPMIGYRFYDKLSAHFGFDLGALLTKKFKQQEEIIKPDGGPTFLDADGNNTNSYIRNKHDGDIPDAFGFQAGVSLGLSYEVVMNKSNTLFAAPELFYTFGFTPIVSGLNWRANALRFGVAIKYQPAFVPPKPKEEFQRRIIIDTVSKQSIVNLNDRIINGISKTVTDTNLTASNILQIRETTYRTDTLFMARIPELKADIIAMGYDQRGNTLPLEKIRMEEFISQRTSPLLNYVFFDENSAEIPDRYNKLTTEQTKGFYEEKFYKEETMYFYYNVLNIFARRLINNPKSTVTLTSIVNDILPEKDNKELFKQRAESIKRYFTEVWDIPDKRIKITTKYQSAGATNQESFEEKMAEMRRVEISSENWDIIRPVFTTDTIRKFSPHGVRFMPQYIAEAGLTNWKITAEQDNKEIRHFEGDDSLPEMINWEISKDRQLSYTTGNPLGYFLDLKDSKNQNYRTDKKEIPVEFVTLVQKQIEKKEDVIIGRYSLILFDFDKADLNASNKKIIEFIKGRIQPNSTVYVTGYTDKIGEEYYNQNLSEQRAISAAKELKMDVKYVKGLGESELLYDTKYPEGRYYCRTVEITIETKIQN